MEAKPEVQSQPPRVREQRPRERPGFPPRGPRPGRGDIEQNESDNRRIIRYPDSHQLFVGNLPHDIDENELKEFFMSKWFTLLYGKIKQEVKRIFFLIIRLTLLDFYFRESILLL